MGSKPLASTSIHFHGPLDWETSNVPPREGIHGCNSSTTNHPGALLPASIADTTFFSRRQTSSALKSCAQNQGNVVRKPRGGTVCCVPGCSSNTSRDRHVSWHVFPKDLHIRALWVKRINRKGWSPTQSSKICGKHFNESGRKRYEDKYPRLFPEQGCRQPHGPLDLERGETSILPHIIGSSLQSLPRTDDVSAELHAGCPWDPQNPTSTVPLYKTSNKVESILP